MEKWWEGSSWVDDWALPGGEAKKGLGVSELNNEAAVRLEGDVRLL